MFIKQHNVSEAQAAIGAPPFNVHINQLQSCVPVYKHTYAHTPAEQRDSPVRV